MAGRITIAGGGIFGLAIAYDCARRGAAVRVYEGHRIGAGASGGLVGALAPHVPENWNEKKAFQLLSLLAADAFWQSAARDGGRDPGYARTGRLQPLADAAAIAQARARAEGASTLWQDRATWQVEEAPPDPWRGTSPTGHWIRDDLTARLNPRAALAALAAAIRALGGEIVEGEAAPTDPPGPMIWATGCAGLTDLAAGSGVKGQAALMACPGAANLPQLFPGGLHIVPHADGTVAIGSTSEQHWQDPDGTDAALDALIARARATCPMLGDAAVIDRWAGLRPRAKSRAPLLGAWPGRPGHFIANGGFKIGFGMAPGVARALTDLVLDGHDHIPAGFRPEALS